MTMCGIIELKLELNNNKQVNHPVQELKISMDDLYVTLFLPPLK